MEKLTYIQRKSHVSSILWLLGCGLGMTYYPIKKVYAGFNLGNTVWLVKKEEGFLCGNKSTHINRLIKSFQNYVLSHPAHTEKVKQIFLHRAQKLEIFIKRLSTFNYAAADNKALYQDYAKIFNAYKQVYPYGEPMAIALGDFAEKIKTHFITQGVSQSDFETLILPSELSFVQRERLELLKIALLAKKSKINEKIMKFLQQHYEKYTWLPYDYGVTYYKLSHFKTELSALLKKGRPFILENYRYLKKYSKILRKRQKTIIKNFNIGKRQVALLGVIKIAFFLVDYKKELFTQCHWYAEKIFSEISRRLKVPKKLMRYMLPKEVRGCLLQGKIINSKKLLSRYSHCVLIIKKTGQIQITGDAKAKTIINNFISSQRQRKQEAILLHGKVANPGIIQGPVRVIMNARNIENFKHGEILVAPMTSPDYIIAIRKSAAIITDEGGIISHAAIVSRELGIPCVIGTKIATKVLKDGDMVEVDANTGIVKIIKER